MLQLCYGFLFSASRYRKGYQKLSRVISMMSYFGLREWQFQNTNIVRLAAILKSWQKNDNHNHTDGHYSHIINRYHHRLNDTSSFTTTNGKLFNESIDQRPFNLEFDMQTIDWNEYFLNYLPGIKRYFFKEHLTNNEINVKRYAKYVSTFIVETLKRCSKAFFSGISDYEFFICC